MVAPRPLLVNRVSNRKCKLEAEQRRAGLSWDETSQALLYLSIIVQPQGPSEVYGCSLIHFIAAHKHTVKGILENLVPSCNQVERAQSFTKK